MDNPYKAIPFQCSALWRDIIWGWDAIDPVRYHLGTRSVGDRVRDILPRYHIGRMVYVIERSDGTTLRSSMP